MHSVIGQARADDQHTASSANSIPSNVSQHLNRINVRVVLFVRNVGYDISRLIFQSLIKVKKCVINFGKLLNFAVYLFKVQLFNFNFLTLWESIADNCLVCLKTIAIEL